MEGGREIVVSPAPEADDGEVRLILLGSAMGALLLQQGVLPLQRHRVDGRCVAFAGPSGYGKSTLAAAFHQRGYRVFADDVVAVRLTPSIWLA